MAGEGGPKGGNANESGASNRARKPRTSTPPLKGFEGKVNALNALGRRRRSNGNGNGKERVRGQGDGDSDGGGGDDVRAGGGEAGDGDGGAGESGESDQEPGPKRMRPLPNGSRGEALFDGSSSSHSTEDEGGETEPCRSAAEQRIAELEADVLRLAKVNGSLRQEVTQGKDKGRKASEIVSEMADTLSNGTLTHGMKETLLKARTEDLGALQKKGKSMVVLSLCSGEPRVVCYKHFDNF